MTLAQRIAPYTALALAICLWGSGFTPTEIALESTSTTTLNVLRAVPAALILVALVWAVRGRRARFGLSATSLISGLLMIGVFTAAISEGTAHAGAANTAVLLNTHPFWVLLLARMFLVEKLPRVGLIGLAVGFAGVVLVVAPQLSGSLETSEIALGLGAALLGAWAWAIGTVIVRRAAIADRNFDVLQLTTGQYVAGAALLLVIGLLRGLDAEWSAPSLWVSVVWLALGTSAIATLAFLYCLRRVEAVQASAWQFLVPVVAIVIEIARGNVPTLIVFLGMTTTILGVCLVTAGPGLAGLRRQEAPAATDAAAP